MGTVLLPLDGSECSEQALAHATARLGPDDELLLLRVMEPPAQLAAIDMLFEQLDVTEGQAYLDDLAQHLEQRGVRARPVAVVGEARQTILEVAAAEKATMIVLATHGRSGLERWFLGSVAEAVVREAPCPVWLVRCSGSGERDELRRQPAPKIASILLPLDLSERSDRALKFIEESFEPGTANLNLLAATNMDWVKGTESAGEIVTQVRAALDERAARLKSAGWAVDVIVDPGTAAQAILDNAARLQVDLIALTSHGRTGAQRWFLGSVAEKVIRHAGCAVLVVRSASR